MSVPAAASSTSSTTSTPRSLRLPDDARVVDDRPERGDGRRRALERLTREAQGALHAVAVAGVAGDDDLHVAGAHVAQLGAALRLSS